MKTILCYGDSNTWGAATVPRPDDRYGPTERWPGVLRGLLGPEWLVIEEGLNARTTVTDDPIEGLERNGRTYLYPCLVTHKPLDVVVIMLGTNDLKARFNKTAWDIAQGAGVLVGVVKTAAIGRGGGAPQILLVSPAPILKTLPFHADVFVGAYEKSLDLPRHYKAVAEREGIRFLEAGTVMKSSAYDGFHLDPDAHAAFAKAIAAEVGKMAVPAPK